MKNKKKTLFLTLAGDPWLESLPVYKVGIREIFSKDLENSGNLLKKVKLYRSIPITNGLLVIVRLQKRFSSQRIDVTAISNFFNKFPGFC